MKTLPESSQGLSRALASTVVCEGTQGVTTLIADGEHLEVLKQNIVALCVRYGHLRLRRPRHG